MYNHIMTPSKRSLGEFPLEPALPGIEDGLPNPHSDESVESLQSNVFVPDPETDPEDTFDNDPNLDE